MDASCIFNSTKRGISRITFVLCLNISISLRTFCHPERHPKYNIYGEEFSKYPWRAVRQARDDKFKIGEVARGPTRLSLRKIAGNGNNSPATCLELTVSLLSYLGTYTFNRLTEPYIMYS